MNTLTMRNIQHYAAKTITRQIITLIASLIAGGGLLMLSIDVAQIVGMSVETYKLSMGFPGRVGLLAIIYWVSRQQHTEGLVYLETIKFGLLYGGVAGVIFSVIYGLSAIVSGHQVLFLMAEITFGLILSLILGLAVGIIHAFSLFVTNFSSEFHNEEMSNLAAIEACRADKLPYRQKVHFFWEMIQLVLMLVILGWALIDIGRDLITVMGMVFACCILVWGVITDISNLINPYILYVEGNITKSYQRMYRSRAWLLHFGSTDFHTYPEIWYKITNGEKYRVWYIKFGRSKRVIAYEWIGYQQQNTQQYRL